ncbi:hypothetical protein EVAR_75092_1 [Eumeta japonica]|uniref:Reverse transcriptase domain-containing protein n=1 Tax=Eumeta variegata TaxID=151549 RepID=A0A4C1U0M8_EUMVA|nr:hypothetical protein EVAR_75092_1 [Eumeta japonica]
MTRQWVDWVVYQKSLDMLYLGSSLATSNNVEAATSLLLIKTAAPVCPITNRARVQCYDAPARAEAIAENLKGQSSPSSSATSLKTQKNYARVEEKTRQYGFTPQRRAEDSLCDLITHIYNEMNLKKIIVMVSLVIQGAFDNAWWLAIKNQLLAHKCPVNLRGMVMGYLRDQEVTGLRRLAVEGAPSSPQVSPLYSRQPFSILHSLFGGLSQTRFGIGAARVIGTYVRPGKRGRSPAPVQLADSDCTVYCLNTCRRFSFSELPADRDIPPIIHS